VSQGGSYGLLFLGAHFVWAFSLTFPFRADVSLGAMWAHLSRGCDQLQAAIPVIYLRAVLQVRRVAGSTPSATRYMPPWLALLGPTASGAHLHWNPNGLLRADPHHSGTRCEAHLPLDTCHPSRTIKSGFYNTREGDLPRDGLYYTAFISERSP
jgi:hypothetical protein